MLRRALLGMTAFLCLCGSAAAQGDRIVTGGLTYSGIQGRGFSNNTFAPAPGGYAEFDWFGKRGNWGFALFGTSFGPTKNSVGSHQISGHFYTPYYGDIRWRRAGSSFTPIAAFGIGWRRLHFDRTEGSTNQAVFSVGGGAQAELGGSMIFQGMAKFNGIARNDLGQNSGYEVQVGIGRKW